jgi:hypothetical protein
MQLRFDEQEDAEGRTSMDRVTRRSGGDTARSTLRKTMAKLEKSMEDSTVLPTLAVPPFYSTD